MSARWCVAAGLLLTGCLETIPLGRECPDQLDSCVDADIPRTSRDPTAQSSDDAGPVDAGPTRDARVDAAQDEPVAAQFPALENSSFEEGDTQLGPVVSDEVLPPWRVCDVASWRLTDFASVQRPSGNAELRVQPSDGMRFLETVVTNAGEPALIYQPLRAPLPRGRYAMLVDVQAADDLGVTIALWSGPACALTRRLDVSARIVPGRWQQVCLTFEVTPSVSIDGLMLVASVGDVTMSGTRVYIDNVRADTDRPDPSCL
jgi:hypothetical protein